MARAMCMCVCLRRRVHVWQCGVQLGLGHTRTLTAPPTHKLTHANANMYPFLSSPPLRKSTHTNRITQAQAPTRACAQNALRLACCGVAHEPRLVCGRVLPAPRTRAHTEQTYTGTQPRRHTHKRVHTMRFALLVAVSPMNLALLVAVFSMKRGRLALMPAPAAPVPCERLGARLSRLYPPA